MPRGVCSPERHARLNNVEALESVRLTNREALEYIPPVPAMRYSDFAERIVSLSFAGDELSVHKCRHDERRAGRGT